MTEPNANLIEARALVCARTLDREGPSRVTGIDLAIEARTMTLIRGAEGCGKNLLLRLLGLLERPEQGEVFFRGAPTVPMTESERAELCNRYLGFVFMTPFLLPAFSVMENIAMPLFKVSEVDPAEARDRIEQLLRFVGLTGLDQEAVSDLTEAQQYRVSLARALANRPAAVFIENLDDGLKGDDLERFAQLLEHAVLTHGVTVIGTTKNVPVSTLPDREIELDSGRIVRDSLVAGKSGGSAS